MSVIEVIEGEPAKRRAVHELPADLVARKLGHESFHGVSIEPDVVIVHIEVEGGLRQVRHQIGE